MSRPQDRFLVTLIRAQTNPRTQTIRARRHGSKTTFPSSGVQWLRRLMTSIRAEEEMARVLLLATALLFGCGDPASDSPTGPHPAQTSGPSTGDPALRVSTSNMAQWARSCALCHVGGEGGAPRIGDPDEWAERIEQGESALLTHTIEGYNRMPPLGYCMDCESEDFEALIRFMAHGS